MVSKNLYGTISEYERYGDTCEVNVDRIIEDVNKYVQKLKKRIDKRIKELQSKENCENIKQTGECRICDNIVYELKNELDAIGKFIGEKPSDKGEIKNE